MSYADQIDRLESLSYEIGNAADDLHTMQSELDDIVSEFTEAEETREELEELREDFEKLEAENAELRQRIEGDGLMLDAIARLLAALNAQQRDRVAKLLNEYRDYEAEMPIG